MMDEHTMRRLFLQHQQQLSNDDTSNNNNAGNLFSLQQQPPNLASFSNNNNNMPAGAANSSSGRTGGDDIRPSIGVFTQNDRITPPQQVDLMSLPQQHQQQQHIVSSTTALLPLVDLPAAASSTSSTTAIAPNNSNSNNPFAGIDAAQRMPLPPQSSHNTVRQRQHLYQAGTAFATGGSSSGSMAASTASAGTAHQFLQSLRNDTQHQHAQAQVQGTDDDDADPDPDASDPLLASLRMYDQYGEDANQLSTASSTTASGIRGGGGGGSGNGNGNINVNVNVSFNANGYLQPNSCGHSGVSGGSAYGGAGGPSSVDDKLQQLQDIQAQLSQLQRMERDIYAQAQAQERQLQQQRLLQQQQQQQQQKSSAMTTTTRTVDLGGGRAAPPTNNDEGGSGSDAAPLSPPSLPIDAPTTASHVSGLEAGPAGGGDDTAQGMRARVQQYEAAARSMLLQRQTSSSSKRGRKKTNATTTAAAATAGTNNPPSVAMSTSLSLQHQQQRRRSSVVSNGSSSCASDATGMKMKRRLSDQSWRDVVKDGPDVQECRVKMRRRVEHYVANCMLSDKAPAAAAASNAPFRRVLATKLEERLYGAAPTFEQYSDSTTLETRLKILAMQIGKRIEGEPGSRKRRRTANTPASATTSADSGDGSGGGSSSNSAASVVEDDTYKRKALRDHLEEDKYAAIVQIVDEIRSIRRTSDVWMSSDSANRRPGTTCNMKSRQAFPASGLEAASAIVAGGGGTISSTNVTYASNATTENKTAETTEETKENSLAEEGREAAATAERKVNIIRPGSPDELTAVESMPRALTAIYFGTRLVDAVTSLGPFHRGSAAQVEAVDWDQLLAEAETNLKAFRILEESTAASDRQTFVEVCTLSGDCRLERAD